MESQRPQESSSSREISRTPNRRRPLPNISKPSSLYAACLHSLKTQLQNRPPLPFILDEICCSFGSSFELSASAAKTFPPGDRTRFFEPARILRPFRQRVRSFTTCTARTSEDSAEIAGGLDTRPEIVVNSRNSQPAACRGRDSDKRRAILKSHHLLLPRATPTPWRAGA